MKIVATKTMLIGAVLAVFWAGLGGVAAANGQAAPKRPMTFADLMAMKRVSDPQISPSGKWVMFSVTDVSLEKNTKVNHLWVVALAGAGTVAPTARPIDRAIATEADRKRATDNPEKQVTFGDGESFGRFSPDGKSVSFSLKNQIYLAPWDEGTGRLGAWGKMTNVAGGADGAIWSPDSKRLMFVADVYTKCSVKGGSDPTHGDNTAMNGAPATWAEEDICDKAKDDAAATSPVKAQVWDSLLYRHWDQYTGEKRSHILVVDADGKNVRDLTPRSAVGDAETPTWFLGAPLQYAWAPDSKEIAFVTNLDKVPAASTNNDVFTLRLDEPGAKAVKVSTSPGSDDEPEYSPDGKWLAFRSQKQAGFESDRFRLMLYDREKKTIKELLPNFDRWVDEFTWASGSRTIYFATGISGTEPIFSIGVDGKDLRRRTHPFDRTGASGEYGSLNVSSDGQTLVSTRMTISSPAEVFVMHLGVESGTYGGNSVCTGYCNPVVGSLEEAELAKSGVYETDRLTHLNDSILASYGIWDGGGESFPWDDFRFTGTDGTQVEGFILRPPGFNAGKKYPVKFVMHGGPQTALGDSWSYRWNWELLAADGYVVVGINRRGSTGYGQKFVDEVSGDWGGRAYEDLMKGLDYAEATYPFIDKTRECALGASYGGFMANWVLTHTNRFKCIVTHDGMFDPVSAYGSTEEMWFNEWEFRRPEDFPKGWDGFTSGYDPMRRSNPPKQSLDGAPGSVGVGHPIPPKQSLNGAPGSVGVGHPIPPKQSLDGAPKGAGHAAEPWRYQNLPADQDPFRKWSPMRFIENAKTPTLVIHSQRDYRLDVSQGFELYTALQRRNVPARFLYFPDEGHWVLKPQNSQLWYETVDDWCDRWTKSGKYAETKSEKSAETK